MYILDKDRIVCYAYMMLTALITINPEKKACSSWDPDPGPILAFQDLRFNQCRHLVTAQKARTSSRGQLERP